MSRCFNLSYHLLWCILIGFVTLSKPLSILLIMPLPLTSYHVWAENLIKGLFRKGHHVHVVSIHETKVEGKLAENLTYTEMRAFLDGAKNGVIVISLGTNVKWKFIGMDKIETVTLAVSKLKQQVLWKLDIEVPFKIPNNLMIAKWMPQNKVLSHKNVRAVWTRGDLLSTHEAIWKGVLMIILPFFMDQKSNMQISVAKGVGIYLDIEMFSTQTILHAIEDVLCNESEFRDRPKPPLDFGTLNMPSVIQTRL